MSVATKSEQLSGGLSQEPVAIIGMDCRLPGADSLDAFWELLASGGYAIERMPDSKLNRDLYYSSEKGVQGKTYSDVGGFVSPRDWDWSVLPIDPSEAGDWDECHLNLCEVAARACLHGGYDRQRLAGENVGVFVGHSGGSTVGGELAFRILAPDYVEVLEELGSKGRIPNFTALKASLLERLQEDRPRRVKGKPFAESSYAAGIISRGLGLTGPYMSIDAACASSLVALAMGADAVRSGQVKMAIVGGASFNKADSLILFSKAQSCSSSASRPFDDRADGLISSEGYVAVVVKTLRQAIEDGDPIQAVIRGIGISSDGRGRSLWAPRKEGQAEAIRRAYAGGVNPQTVQMLEAHATSTQVGDATEMEALSGYFAEQLPPGVKLPVGSVKSNIGHTLETAGLAGLIKSVLAIHNETIPPSVNVEQLSRSIPWDDIPLYVARECEPWPRLPNGQPRRAAVNAFGIGGLNVHVVLEQYLSDRDPVKRDPVKREAGEVKVAPRSPAIRQEQEPIAIIGRGVVLPGVDSLPALQGLLQRPVPQLCLPPPDRSRAAMDPPIECGFITDFEYDWRRHRVPPRQISQANPLQFMLLEAAEQALSEAGFLQRGFDKQRTAVVVGASFGGDFANALFAGLRLPEIREHMLHLLSEQGCEPNLADEIWNEYEHQFLIDFPAVLDETGSFTSSTLASRLSKTFDLMGGALAVDSGDVSGLAALDASCRLLRSGQASHVLCAAAQRALDRAALDNLWQLGRLPAAIADAKDGYSVGEGVALIILKRVKQAVADGDQILATINQIAVANHPQSLQDSYLTAKQRLSIPHSESAVAQQAVEIIGGTGNIEHDQALVAALGIRQNELRLSPTVPCTGQLQATQGLVDIIASSLVEEPDRQQTLICGNSIGGQTYLVDLQGALSKKRSVSTINDRSPLDYSATGNDRVRVGETRKAIHHNRDASLGGESSRVCVQSDPSQATEAFALFRFEADDRGELQKLLRKAEVQSITRFHGSAWRAAVVCKPSELSEHAARLAKQLGVASASVPLAEQGMFWSSPEQRPRKSRIAWLFPGQGSQRTGMLHDLCQNEQFAAEELSKANEILSQLGMPSFQEIAWIDDLRLGNDLWTTQSAMLICDWVMQRTLRARGLEPDLVSGHSYGEFAALAAAGSWDLETALKATRLRCECLNEYVVSGCRMLSVNRSSSALQKILDEQRLPLSVSHSNSPTQSVVGGRLEHLEQLADELTRKKIANRLLPVPTAFHTPFLAAAVNPFQQKLNSVEIDPPRIPLLSSVTQQYVADPGDIRRNLARQLESHLDFVSLVKRLESDGVKLVVEVGPQQVLSRLVRQITDQFVVVSMDHERAGAARQLLCVQAAVEVHTNSRPLANESDDGTSLMKFPPVHFDATRIRKERLKQQSQQVPEALGQHLSGTRKVTESVHFDATVRRRDIRRAQASSSSPRRELETTRAPKYELAEKAACAEQVESPASEGTIADGQSLPGSMHQFLIDFVVEQTGYPADLLELDWDLEADLGIDSIKKAQLFGELRELLPLESDGRGSLDEFRTLRDILEFLEQLPKGTHGAGSGEATDPLADIERPETSSGSAAIPGQDQSPSKVQLTAALPQVDSDSLQSDKKLTQFLVDFVVEQTGYPPDIVELDADLEADLGIDSIKKAQLLGEIRELFGLNAELTGQSQLSQPTNMPQFRSLREIRDSLLAWTTDAAVEDAAQVAAEQWSGSEEPEPSLDQDDVTTCKIERAGQADRVIEQPVRQSLSVHDLSSSAGEVPRATLVEREVGRFECDASEGFKDSARRNLQALVARRGHGATLTQHDLSTGPVWYAQRAACMAEVIGCTAEALHSLDQALHLQAEWKFAQASPGSQADALLWLCGLQASSWMHHTGGTALTEVLCTGGETDVAELLPAGSLLPLATIGGNRMLMVARIVSSDAQSFADHQALTRFLQTAGGGDIECLADRLSELELATDWQLMVVDRKTSESFVASSLNNRLRIDFRAPQSVFDDPSREAGVIAAIGLDNRTGAFVAWSSRGYSSLTSPLQVQLDDSQATHGTSELSAAAPIVKSTVAKRYTLRMVPAPARRAPSPKIVWGTTALIVGENTVADELEQRLRSEGLEVIRFSTEQDSSSLAVEFRRLTRDRLIAHLFLTSPLDADAETRLDAKHWSQRCRQAILGPYWLCQQWLSHIVEMELTDHASLVAVTSLGGDFGIASKPRSIEGGGLAGLLKSMLVESWTQGYRPLTIKILDSAAEDSASEIVDQIWGELEAPSYDIEISYREARRHVLRAVANPVEPANANRPVSVPTSGGVWICTGGARGITAYVAEKLAKRYGLKLHLIGKSPVPSVQPSWRELDSEGLRELKIGVMTAARKTSRNPLEAWQDIEKALEIDATVHRLKAAGIEVYYHSCDVADGAAVEEIVAKIREQSGQIHGILHGAGVGKDSRFDRKQVEKVEQCIAAKVDGALALMEATQEDPIEFFLGFGSISGRFGANGHTDYSLANDMLCKLIDWYARLRPEVRSVGFHWHAWGDVGMATKPETRLALEMVDMQFMPALEGVQHLVNELESDARDSEVLITDDRYYRMFYPAEHLPRDVEPGAASENGAGREMGSLLTRRVSPNCGGSQAFAADVNPGKDPFLTEHLLQGKPLLPFVIATEMLWEAASQTLSSSDVELYSIEAISGVRFFNEVVQQLRVETTLDAAGTVQCQLFNDFVARNGRLVEADRLAFRAIAEVREDSSSSSLNCRSSVRIQVDDATSTAWQPVSYPAADSEFFVGWPLQRLRSVQVRGDSIIGKISAPALIELAGNSRRVAAWRVPSAAMDACLFAVGILAWDYVGPGVALPVRIGKLSIGDRLPGPGEACQVHARFKSEGRGRAVFDFSLYGIDDELLLTACDYEVAWLDKSMTSGRLVNSEVGAHESRGDGGDPQ